MSQYRILVAMLGTLVILTATLVFWYVHQPQIVTAKIVATVNDEPVSRWMLQTDRVGEERWVEVGPALFYCFEIGDEYRENSLGRCEGVVWP